MLTASCARATTVLLSAILLLATLGAAPPAAGAEPVDTAQIEQALATLEDPEKRAELTATLRALLQATAEPAEPADTVTVKTAAAEMLETLSVKVETLSGSASTLFSTINEVPELVGDWREDLRTPEVRERWLLVVLRLVAVIGAGFVAARLLAWALRRLRRKAAGRGDVDMAARAVRLVGVLVVDLLPIVAFAAVSYGVLTMVDPLQETRLVAVALINASILSRLVLAVAAAVLAPDLEALRLWGLGDESAHYLYQWTRRISIVVIYGFFGLQAALLLGLDPEAYQTLLRILGALVLGMLLVLIAQNRHDVARAIAPEAGGEAGDELALSSVRRGLARVWHLMAGLYLMVIYAIWALKIENGAEYLIRATALSIVAIAVGRLLAHGIGQAFDRGLRLSGDLRTRFPGLEARLNRYFPALRRVVGVAIAAGVILVVLDAWGIDTLSWITTGSGRVLLAAILQIFFILAVAFFLWEFASGWIERYLAETDQYGRARTRSARTRTLLTVARNALMVVLTVVTLLMVLSELGINIAPLLAGAGVVGLAIGFGAQRLVQDVINGAFILFQDLMSVGDVVKLGDKAGVVEALSIRTVRLRDLAGVVHTIPFSTIEGVSNLTRDFSFHVFDLGIAYRENVDEVIELIHEVGEELRADPDIGPLVLEPVEVFGLDAFGDSAIMIKGRIKTLPIKQWQVGRAFNRLVKLRFDERGIEIPFPHRTLYFGADKDGSAPPAFLQMESLMQEPAPGRGEA